MQFRGRGHLSGLLFAALGLLLILSACGSRNIAVQLDAGSGVIFSEQNAQKFAFPFSPKPGGYWTPTEAQVKILEAALPAYLQDNSQLFYRQPPVWERLNGYNRQYVGLIEANKQVIFANFFCQDMGVDWRKEPVEILDGGECYFQVKFDIASQSFFSIIVNGEA